MTGAVALTLPPSPAISAVANDASSLLSALPRGPLGESKGREERKGTQFMQGGSGVPAEKIVTPKEPNKDQRP